MDTRIRLFALLAFAGCSTQGSGDTSGEGDADTDSDTDTDTDTIGGVLLPDVTGVEFVAGVDNPFFPLPVGATWVYDVASTGEHIEVEVTAKTEVISGVTAVVVHDVAYDGKGGPVVEDTDDWFAQDVDGNVWYLGEATCEYEKDECVDTGGSWTWGVDGALPGVVMWASPEVDGQPYYQEYLEEEAEDVGEVVELRVDVDVPAGSFTGCVRTHDTSTLELTADEQKYYCPGIGLVLTDVEEGLTSSSLVP